MSEHEDIKAFLCLSKLCLKNLIDLSRKKESQKLLKNCVYVTVTCVGM